MLLPYGSIEDFQSLHSGTKRGNKSSGILPSQTKSPNSDTRESVLYWCNAVRIFPTTSMSENTNMEQLSIPEFYKGRSVFITGATGFMGKVLVEKLLRSCPGIERIYLLMRPSKGQSVECRLQDLINNQVRILNSAFEK